MINLRIINPFAVIYAHVHTSYDIPDPGPDFFFEYSNPVPNP